MTWFSARSIYCAPTELIKEEKNEVILTLEEFKIYEEGELRNFCKIRRYIMEFISFLAAQRIIAIIRRIFFDDLKAMLLTVVMGVIIRR